MYASDKVAAPRAASAPGQHRTAAPPHRPPRSGLRALQGRAGNAATFASLHGGAAPDRAAHPAAAATAVQRAPGSGHAPAPAPAAPVRQVSPRAAHRLDLAEAANRYAKSMIPAAGNQHVDLAATGFNSALRARVARHEEFWDLSRFGGRRPSKRVLRTAMAAGAGGGNCNQYADIAYSYLRVQAAGEVIRKVDVPGVDHVFVVIGDPREPDHEWAVADAWPGRARACLWDDYFLHTPDRSRIRDARSMVADGRDDVDFVRSMIRPNRAGEFVAGWSVQSFAHRGLHGIAEDLRRFGIAVGSGPHPDLHGVLSGLATLADAPVADVVRWDTRALNLWCASQVDPGVLGKVFQEGSADGRTLARGIAEARSAGGLRGVQHQAASTGPGREFAYTV